MFIECLLFSFNGYLLPRSLFPGIVAVKLEKEMQISLNIVCFPVSRLTSVVSATA